MDFNRNKGVKGKETKLLSTFLVKLSLVGAVVELSEHLLPIKAQFKRQMCSIFGNRQDSIFMFQFSRPLLLRGLFFLLFFAHLFYCCSSLFSDKRYFSRYFVKISIKVLDHILKVFGIL